MNLFTIKSSTGSIIPVVPASDKKFQSRLLHFADAYQTESDFGDMLFQRVGFRASDLWFSYYRMYREMLLYGLVGDPLLEAHITLRDRYVQSLGKDKDSIYESGQFNLTGAPYMENKVLFPKDGEYVSFDIHPSLALLENLAQDFGELADFLNIWYGKPQEAVSLYHTPLFISPSMNHLVNKILHHLKSPAPKRSYAEILIQELLILLLLRGETTKQPGWKLKQHDIEALHFAKDIIIQEGQNDEDVDLYYTSDQLADKIELSLYRFKRGFKQLFGTSPYSMLIEIRLHKARRLLKDTRLSILQIAVKSGYRSSESFAKAYKKLFGISPSEERK